MLYEYNGYIIERFNRGNQNPRFFIFKPEGDENRLVDYGLKDEAHCEAVIDSGDFRITDEIERNKP